MLLRLWPLELEVVRKAVAADQLRNAALGMVSAASSETERQACRHRFV